MISTRWFAIQIQAVATTSCILELIWISYSIINVKILVLIKWSYRSSQLCWLLNLVWLACFEHVVQSLKYISFWCSFLDPHLTTHHTNTGIQVITNVKIGHVYLACEPGDIFCFALGNRPIFATHGCLCCVFCMWRTGVESTYWWQGKVNILFTYSHWLFLKETFDVLGNKWIFDNSWWKYLSPTWKSFKFCLFWHVYLLEIVWHLLCADLRRLPYGTSIHSSEKWLHVW